MHKLKPHDRKMQQESYRRHLHRMEEILCKQSLTHRKNIKERNHMNQLLSTSHRIHNYSRANDLYYQTKHQQEYLNLNFGGVESTLRKFCASYSPKQVNKSPKKANLNQSMEKGRNCIKIKRKFQQNQIDKQNEKMFLRLMNTKPQVKFSAKCSRVRNLFLNQKLQTNDFSILYQQSKIFQRYERFLSPGGTKIKLKLLHNWKQTENSQQQLRPSKNGTISLPNIIKSAKTPASKSKENIQKIGFCLCRFDSSDFKSQLKLKDKELSQMFILECQYRQKDGPLIHQTKSKQMQLSTLIASEIQIAIFQIKDNQKKTSCSNNFDIILKISKAIDNSTSQFQHNKYFPRYILKFNQNQLFKPLQFTESPLVIEKQIHNKHNKILGKTSVVIVCPQIGKPSNLKNQVLLTTSDNEKNNQVLKDKRQNLNLPLQANE